MAETQTAASEPAALKTAFEAFTKLVSGKKIGGGGGGGGGITLPNLEKWFKQAGLFDKNITSTDADTAFKEVSKNKETLDWTEFQEFLKVLAKNKNIDLEKITAKLGSIGIPGLTGASAGGMGDAMAGLKKGGKLW